MTEVKQSKFSVSFGPKMAVANPNAFGGGRPSEYPWDQMPEPKPNAGPNGETLYAQFFVPGKTTKNFSGAAQSAGKRLNATFVVRAAQLEEPEGSGNFVHGVLVQRVEYRQPRTLSDQAKAERKAKADATRARKKAEKAAAAQTPAQ